MSAQCKLFTRFLVLAAFVIIAGISAITVDGLTISPPKIEISGKPGDIVSGNIALFNEESVEKTFYSSFENFEAQGESGAPYFVGCRDGLCKWIDAPKSVSIRPGERIEVPFTIRIPEDAKPGGEFAAIFWSSFNPDNMDGQVAIGAKIGVLVLLGVEGEIEEKGGILEFSSEQGRVVSNLPVVFGYRFSNDGGDRVNPKGVISIKNIFGVRVAEIDANKGEGNVLPGSIRKIKSIWHTKRQNKDDLTKREEIKILIDAQDEANSGKASFWSVIGRQINSLAMGPYFATLELEYGNDYDNKDVSKYVFFVFPWQMIVVALACVGILIILIGRYNRWIIARARR